MTTVEDSRFSIASLLSDRGSSELAVRRSTGPSDVRNHVAKCIGGSIAVALENKDLWQTFSVVGTEMILTKTGRRMFPSLSMRVSGLDPDARYEMSIEMEALDSKRYRYCYETCRWLDGHDEDGSGNNAGKERPPSPDLGVGRRLYVHPDSPSTGAEWMRQAVSFAKMKLTNNQTDDKGHIVLQSMHKYRPRLNVACSRTGQVRSFTFAETTFIAVTAYQNQRITKLKIDWNPFAKGFREGRQAPPDRDIFSAYGCNSTSSAASSPAASPYHCRCGLPPPPLPPLLLPPPHRPPLPRLPLSPPAFWRTRQPCFVVSDYSDLSSSDSSSPGPLSSGGGGAAHHVVAQDDSHFGPMPVIMRGMWLSNPDPYKRPSRFSASPESANK